MWHYVFTTKRHSGIMTLLTCSRLCQPLLSLGLSDKNLTRKLNLHGGRGACPCLVGIVYCILGCKPLGP